MINISSKNRTQLHKLFDYHFYQKNISMAQNIRTFSIIHRTALVDNHDNNQIQINAIKHDLQEYLKSLTKNNDQHLTQKTNEKLIEWLLDKLFNAIEPSLFEVEKMMRISCLRFRF